MQQRGIKLFKGGLFFWRVVFFFILHLSTFDFSDILQPYVQPDLR